MNRLERYWVFILAFLAVAIICGGGVLYSKRGDHQLIEILLPPPTPSPQVEVYVGGAVANPGFYLLKEGDRIEDLLLAADGTTEGADLTRLKIYVPEVGETSASQPQKVDINSAEAWLLDALPGIGEKTARKIIDYRNENGRFQSIRELMKVEGIGPATYDKLKGLIAVD